MSSIWGQNLHISLFGESHGPGIGVVIDGLPSGFAIDEQALVRYQARRAPGLTPWSTPRQEKDQVEILSGYFRGRTTGAPLAALIRNTDTRSRDYEAMLERPRPGHADWTAGIRYQGYQDPRGSGHFSGRLTAPVVFAGAVCSQILAQRQIHCHAHALDIAGVADRPFDPCGRDSAEELAMLASKPLAVFDDEAAQLMIDRVLQASGQGDSVGGIVEAMICGLPAGLGEPFFSGIEPRLAGLLFGIPAVKGVDFGAGFRATGMLASEHNDVPLCTGGTIRHRTNNSGGSLGGISTGMPVLCRVAIKPPASIAREQETVNLKTCQPDRLSVGGRHDPCIVPRAVPVIEAACALFALDMLMDLGRLSP